MVLYDGLHYDAMVLTRPGASKDEDVTVFPSTGPEAEEVDAKARAVVDEAHRARAFTDVANFTLRCLVCQKGLVGEKDGGGARQVGGAPEFSEY